MKKILATLFVILTITTAKAQETAPNLKGTDIYGKFYNSYSDYFANGKFLFLDFFTNTCTFCQYLAPKVDTAYRFFGCGCGDVDFFAINTSSYSNDENVLEFAMRFGISFNPISADGGSVNISEAYEVPYTPYTFIVAPDTTIVAENMNIHTAQDIIDTLLALGLTPTECQKAEIRHLEILKNGVSYKGDVNYEQKEISFQLPDTLDLSNLKMFYVLSSGASLLYDTNSYSEADTLIFDNFTDTLFFTVKAKTDTIQNVWKAFYNTFQTGTKSLRETKIFYPNPANGKIFLNKQFQGSIVKIYSLSGGLVSIKIAYGNQIDIKDLKRGTYLFIIDKNGKTFSEKIIVK